MDQTLCRVSLLPVSFDLILRGYYFYLKTRNESVAYNRHYTNKGFFLSYNKKSEIN